MAKKKSNDLRSDMADEDPPSSFTSMIDIVFLLLIFFLVATRFKQPEKRLDAQLPKDEGLMSKKFDPKKPEELCIFVKDDRETRRNSKDFQRRVLRKATYYLGARTATPTDNPYSFKSFLQQRASNPEQAVLISLYSETPENADQKTPFQNIIKVVDVCKMAGIKKIKFQGPAVDM